MTPVAEEEAVSARSVRSARSGTGASCHEGRMRTEPMKRRIKPLIKALGGGALLSPVQLLNRGVRFAASQGHPFGP